MKVVGIVAEYNPFHIGHAYLIQKAKEITKADYCVIVMSGDYVQRGAPAIMDKYLRAQIALQAGADLVLELPVYYSLGSAEYFASGAIALLDRLGIVNCICFGSENGDISVLDSFASVLLEESDSFKTTLKSNLKSGCSYPLARNNALIAESPELAAHIGDMTGPNNILGIEYCKAIKRRGSTIKAYTVKRAGSSYHSASLEDSYCSALAIREALIRSDTIDAIKGQLPEHSHLPIENNFRKTFPVTADDFSILLHYQLLNEADADTLTKHPDIDEAFAERIRKYLPQYKNFSSFCDMLKSKNFTYARIARSMMHILLCITTSDLKEYMEDDYVYYAKMLGFREDSSLLLTGIKESSSVPLLSKLADASCLLDEKGNRMLKKDIHSNRIYQAIVNEKFHPESDFLYNEYQRRILKL